MNENDIKRIKEIKERTERATSGKWRVEKCYHDEPYEEYIKSAVVVTKNYTITRNDWSNPAEDDLDFIANAREDIPYLLVKIEELAMFENGSKQLCEEIKFLVNEKENLINALRYVKEQYETDFAELETRDKSIYTTVADTLNKIDI